MRNVLPYSGQIVAAGLSPAWQSIMEFESLLIGEVNRAAQTWQCASGKVLNVAVAAEHLGSPVRAVTVLGGPPADATAREMAMLGIELVAVPTHGETRTCTTLLERGTGQTTELVENAAAIEPDELAAFVTAFRDAVTDASVVVLSGSLPAGTPVTFYRELLELSSCPVVLDARGPELLEALPLRPLLVKPNREELAKTLGRRLDNETAVFSAMHELHDRGAEWVLITDGSRPALVLGPEGRGRIQPLPVDRVVNPIGCGDCLAAGFAAGLARGLPPSDAMRLGVAAASENCRTLLAGRLEPQAVAQVAQQVVLEPV